MSLWNIWEPDIFSKYHVSKIKSNHLNKFPLFDLVVLLWFSSKSCMYSTCDDCFDNFINENGLIKKSQKSKLFNNIVWWSESPQEAYFHKLTTTCCMKSLKGSRATVFPSSWPLVILVKLTGSWYSYFWSKQPFMNRRIFLCK